jgi:hypothetical protein
LGARPAGRGSLLGREGASASRRIATTAHLNFKFYLMVNTLFIEKRNSMC